MPIPERTAEVSVFPSQILHRVSSLLCREQLAVFMEEKHTVAEKASSLALPTNNHVTRRTSKQDQFPSELQCCSSTTAPSVHVPRLRSFYACAATVLLPCMCRDCAPSMHVLRLCSFHACAATVLLLYMCRDCAPSMHVPRLCSFYTCAATVLLPCMCRDCAPSVHVPRLRSIHECAATALLPCMCRDLHDCAARDLCHISAAFES